MISSQVVPCQNSKKRGGSLQVLKLQEQEPIRNGRMKNDETRWRAKKVYAPGCNETTLIPEPSSLRANSLACITLANLDWV